MPTLHWIGKEKVLNHHEAVPFRVLRHCYGFDGGVTAGGCATGSGNKIIHGDNLEALKALLPQYEGKIDCIYIDPPYNTGNEGWVYNDNVNDPQMRRWLGEVVGPESEDLSRHDKWACMMYPRLVLMHKLLSDRGAIFISNDDNENQALRAICDEIFGRNSFVNNVLWQKAYSPKGDSKGMPSCTEYVTVYSKQPRWMPNRLERTEEMDAIYKNIDNDVQPWTSSDAFASDAATHQGMVYAIQHPFTGEMIYPYSNGHWRYSQDAMLEIMNGWCEYELRDLHDDEQRAAVCNVPVVEVRKEVKGIVLRRSLEESRAAAQGVYDRGQWPRFYFTNGGKGGIRRKTYLDNVEGRLVTDFWPFSEVGHTDGAKKELKRIFGGNIPFDTPKPTKLVQRIIEIATDEYSTVLDCFAGSGTTAHAVMLQNAKDKGSRKFILVEMMDYASTTTAERVKRAIVGYPCSGKQEDVIYSKKLTTANIVRGEQMLAEAQQAIELNRGRYDKIGKPRIADNCLTVTATKVIDGQMPGLGGAFDYYELGEPLFLPDGNLNEAVGVEQMRQYVYYTETRQYLGRQQDPGSPYLLDCCDGTAYYFCYEPDRATVLSPGTLHTVAQQAQHYVIYADLCALDKEQLAQLNITFKKIPRDINRF